MTDLRNFVSNTDYPMDKIIYFHESSTTLDAGLDSVTVPVAVGLAVGKNVELATFSITPVLVFHI